MIQTPFWQKPMVRRRSKSISMMEIISSARSISRLGDGRGMKGDTEDNQGGLGARAVRTLRRCSLDARNGIHPGHLSEREKGKLEAL